MSKCQTINCKAPPPPPPPDKPPNSDNLHTVFPELHVRPRPRPIETHKDDYDAWLKEYEEWRNVRCPCGEGYFCREHGSWVSGPEVRDGVAAAADEQKEGSCPASHYEGYGGVTTYIGTRDAVIASHPAA